MSTPPGSRPDACSGTGAGIAIGALGIGELAARTQRTTHAIRWYETQGLMPGVLRDAGGRRRYNARHVDWLLLLDRLRRTGMSIAEIRRYAALVAQGRVTLAERRALLAAHRQRVLDTMAEWQQALALLDAKIDFYGDWLAHGKRPPPLTDVPAPAPARAPPQPARKRRGAARGQP